MYSELKHLDGTRIHIHGVIDDYVNLVTEYQLKSSERWKLIVDVFKTKDDKDGMWRGEFFGKMMRGASLIYAYSKDEELYSLLESAVKNLLTAQESDGRISTYSREHEFFGWDMWCRKYVLTGLQHFYDICKDSKLKERILNVCIGHVNYITEHIGPGKTDITTTSSWWGCVNSCTILEPVIKLYMMTGEQRFLEFAEYIISCGGSNECNFIELALENRLAPYQYPVVKAYETMSFFEGLLAYYEISGEEKYLTAVKNFMLKVSQNEITLIGCAGCTSELFDNAAVTQTEYSEEIMQETCVTVTWMRILTRLYLLTEDPEYLDPFEISLYNALYGSVNSHKMKQLNLFSKKLIDGITFESYSPLCFNSRGRGVGGYLEVGGGHCGCCDAIGACGIALAPLNAVVVKADSVMINYLFGGEVLIDSDTKLKFESGYPKSNSCKITVVTGSPRRLNLKIRKPDWADKMTVGEREITQNGYFTLSKVFGDGDTVNIEMATHVKLHRLNGKIAFTYGALTLAADENKSEIDFAENVTVSDDFKYRFLKPVGDEFVRIEVACDDGSSILLTDYQSCGKLWTNNKNKISVWLNSNAI